MVVFYSSVISWVGTGVGIWFGWGRIVDDYIVEKLERDSEEPKAERDEDGLEKAELVSL